MIGLKYHTKDPGYDLCYSQLEMFRNEPLLLFIITLGVACSIGGIPPIWKESAEEESRTIYPQCWKHFQTLLEQTRSTASHDAADRNTGALGKLLKETLAESHASSFDAASFATKSRSSYKR